MPALCSDPVADVVAAVDKLRVDDRLITSGDVLLGDVEALLGTISTLQAVVVRRVRAARDVDATVELYGRSTKRWLIEDQLLAGPEAGRLTRLMNRLPDHPLTEAALDDGRINTQHAGAILTALQSLPADLHDTVEPHLIARALDHPPEEIAGFVDELLQALGVDKQGDVARERRHTQRGVDIASTLHGGRSLSGTLTPDVGERVEAALTHASQKAGPDDDRHPRQRRHDALGVIADAYLAHQQPSFGGAPRSVIVTLDLDTLQQRVRDTLVTLPGGATLSAETARRLAC